ncbi:MAG: tRNA lysidine(34) synthetase TilS [Bacteroidales bacterium]|nr:tRNA lysidine(34) synthetase TilS [Bacteroidales bacterium]
MRDRFDRCLDGSLPCDGGAVLLAVSGGIDSMVMADLFLGSPHKYDISLAHCNFHLRGEESYADEAFVREWAGAHGLRFFKKDFDTEEYASAKGISVEMAARELRYSWFASLCEDHGFVALAVAHNANDNAETLILNLLRGTGLKGVLGMREVSPLPGSSASLIRPMLGFSREEIKEYALSKGLEWREDSTNADSAYKRNLIRNEVFPLFSKVNPSFLDSLNADMRRFSQVQEVADGFVSSLKPTVMSDNTIQLASLVETPHWEYLLFRLLEPYGFNEAVIGDMIELIKSGNTFSGREFHSQTHLARTSRGSITVETVSREVGKLASDSSIVVSGPGEYSLEGVGFVVETSDIQEVRQPSGTTVANLRFPITIRRWQSGDWMRPLGMKGCRKKLSDMFNDLKFDTFQKEKALVIADEGSHVHALIGYRIDESVAVRSSEGAVPAIRIRLI